MIPSAQWPAMSEPVVPKAVSGPKEVRRQTARKRARPRALYLIVFFIHVPFSNANDVQRDF
jgi:hypothetical protein